MWTNATRRYLAAGAMTIGSVLAIGVPTDVIDTDLFTRMTPVRWWEYPVLALTAALTGLWVAIPRVAADTRGRSGVMGAIVGAVLAVGCPICNKVVVALLGVSGALGLWAPMQPVLAIVSLVALATAVVIRVRRRGCSPDSCATGSNPRQTLVNEQSTIQSGS